MEKITMGSFKNNKLFIATTLILGAVLSLSLIQAGMIEPVYYKEDEAWVGAIVMYVLVVPLLTLWFQMVWNIILIRIFPLKQISYGVAFLLSIILSIFFTS